MTAPPQNIGKPSSYWQQTVQNRMLLVTLVMMVSVSFLASPANQGMQNLANYALRVMAALLFGILILRARVKLDRRSISSFLGTGAHLAVLLYFLASAVSVGLD